MSGLVQHLVKRSYFFSRSAGRRLPGSRWCRGERPKRSRASSSGLEGNLLSWVWGRHTFTLVKMAARQTPQCCRKSCCSIFPPRSPPYDMFTKYLFRMRQRRRLRHALPSSPRGCSAVNGSIICQLWQCLEAASERYKEATDKESIRRAVNCLQSPGAGEYLKSMGLKTD